MIEPVTSLRRSDGQIDLLGEHIARWIRRRQGDVSPVERDFARIWQAAEKVVFAKTLMEHRFRNDVVHLHYRNISSP